MSLKAILRLDWCSHEAAKYAVEKWHYSGSLPVAKTVRIGVWENDVFIGVVLFSWGASPNIGKPYGLQMVNVAELVRVALSRHQNRTTRIVSIAIKLLCRQSPGIRLLVSYADTEQGHVGGIYQGGNWIYAGTTAAKFDYACNGKKLQRRAYTGSNFGSKKLELPKNAVKVMSPVKHRYLMPLDDEMRKQIEPLRKPYPKRVRSVAGDTPADQAGEGGSTPTRTL